MKTLAAILSAELERIGWSYYRLAVESDLAESGVRRIAQGTQPNPGILTVRLILAAIRKDLAWLEREYAR